MNQRTKIVSPSRLNPYDGVCGSPLGDFASNPPGLRFSAYSFAMCGTEVADPAALGQGLCN
jgi:hypothetical protein